MPDARTSEWTLQYVRSTSRARVTILMALPLNDLHALLAAPPRVHVAVAAILEAPSPSASTDTRIP